MKYNFLAILAILFFQNALAQKNITITEKVTDKKELLQFAKFEKNINGKDEQSIIEILQSVLRNEDQSFTYKFKQAQKKDELGYEHKEYQQYYKGIKVYGATYAVHIKDGSIDFINGEFANLSNFNIVPTQKAETIFKVAFNEAQNKYKLITEKYVQVSNLVIAKDVFSEKQEYKLGYEVSIKNLNELIDEIYYIDANTGKILNKEFKVCHTNTTNAIAQTAYSGTQNYTNGFPISSPNFVTDSYAGGFRLRENREGVNIVTLNNLNQNYSDVGNSIEFSDNDNNWTQAEHGNNRFALDAHWGAEKVFDYWKTVHNRNSIDNAGMNIRSYVHTVFPLQLGGTTPNNAAWSNSGNYMSYGDGDGTIFRNLTSLDICAHEFGHGICQYTSNLAYNYNESGSLNEGFSDIWGAVIEAWAMPNNPPKNRWLIGEEVYVPAPNYLRSMNNPNSSPNLQPDTYGGTFWTNGGIEMHKGSGVLNYWFYLLTEGGSGTNDLGNTYTVLSIGITKAAAIAYKTEQLLSSGSNYSQARTISIQAAEMLYGVGSCEAHAVKNAWYAVGVGTNPGNLCIPNISPVINGPSTLCVTNPQAQYSINLPSGSSNITWSTSYNLYAPSGYYNTNPITIARVPSEPHVGNSTINATFTAPVICNQNTQCQYNSMATFNLQKIVQLGNSNGTANLSAVIKRWCIPTVNNSCVQIGSYNDFIIQITNNINNLQVISVDWSINNGATILSSNSIYNAVINIPSAGSYTITAVINFNNCTSKTITRTVNTGNCPCNIHWSDAARYSNPTNAITQDEEVENETNIIDETKQIGIYPNPVIGDQLYINLNDDKSEYTYKIISLDGRIVRLNKILDEKAINIEELPNGIYFLELISNKIKNTYKFILNR